MHGNFAGRLTSLGPALSQNERRLACPLRLGTTNAEIASLLHVQPASFRTARYRLKQRLGLDKETDLESWVAEI